MTQHDSEMSELSKVTNVKKKKKMRFFSSSQKFYKNSDLYLIYWQLLITVLYPQTLGDGQLLKKGGRERYLGKKGGRGREGGERETWEEKGQEGEKRVG